MTDFWDERRTMSLTGRDVRMLFTGMLRYELGRSGSRDEWVARCIESHAHELDVGTLQVLINDIERERAVRDCSVAFGIEYRGHPERYIAMVPLLMATMDEKLGNGV